MKKICILGANGRLGHMAARRFYAAGYLVTAVSRSGHVQDLPAGILHRKAEALDASSLLQATAGTDFIFNALNPVYTNWAQHALPMAENVMKAAAAHQAIHLFPGNVYNYGSEMPARLTADTPFSPTTAKGEIRCAMEAMFKSRAEHDTVKTIILRAGDFFGGARLGSWFDLVLKSKLHKSILLYPGPVDIPHSWAYLPDFADAFVHIADEIETYSGFENLVFEGHTLTGQDIRTALGTILGHPLKVGGLPWALLKAGGIVKPMWREVSDMKYLWFTPHQLEDFAGRGSSAQFQQTPTIDAFRAALDDLGFPASRLKAA
ncbi:MAG: NAD-dependent epimerase/dehydratase family protein [Sneathiella sp.]